MLLPSAPPVCAPSQSIWDLHRIPNSLHHVTPGRKIIGKCLGISYNKACEHRLGDESILPALNANQRQHTTTDRLLSDQLLPALPAKGFLLLEGHVEEEAGREKGSPGHAAHCRAPSRNAASSHGWNGDLGTPGPWGQSCPTKGPLSPTENNSLCSSWPNIKCHFHTNFQAWTQVFVFQGMLQKAFAFCTDGYSQDLENNPPELMRLDFPPYEIIISVIFLNIKGYS